ncbi:hypothetical protein C2845_PM05G36660 [Panicum miliaceum]|uniref:Uncharacterized protein n=1 Tax=Panicum miliaceum TaxID=4540 RepID=A0A3L6SXA9_PANMI|nr:hypothetical protein C2845_PM05G36660 [Panicum miliaceum]
MAMLLTQDVKVNLSVMNNDGATPLDVAINELDHGQQRRDEDLDKRAGAGGSERELSKSTVGQVSVSSRRKRKSCH